MKKYENQLPQAGRGNVHVAYQGKAIDQMIYEILWKSRGYRGMTLANCSGSLHSACCRLWE